MRSALGVPVMAAAFFVVLAAGFLLIIGQPPFATLKDLVLFAFGDTYSLSETLVKTTPILLCALAVILPARLGLISVGADGQLYLGALVGTGLGSDAGIESFEQTEAVMRRGRV